MPPEFLPTSSRSILFPDELTAAPQMSQAGCYQLVLHRKLGEYGLSTGRLVPRSVPWLDSRPIGFRSVLTRAGFPSWETAEMECEVSFSQRMGHYRWPTL